MAPPRARTIIRLEPAGDGRWTAARHENGAEVEGTRTLPWPWPRATMQADAAARELGCQVVTGSPPPRPAIPPPARPDIQPATAPRSGELHVTQQTCAWGRLDVPCEIRGAKTVRP